MPYLMNKCQKRIKFDFNFFLMMSYLDSSHFSDNNGYIICRISIYRFKDINYACSSRLSSCVDWAWASSMAPIGSGLLDLVQRLVIMGLPGWVFPHHKHFKYSSMHTLVHRGLDALSTVGMRARCPFNCHL